MLIREFIDAFNDELPLALAMKDDPVGLQVLAAERELSSIAVAYEVDERVVAHAAEAGAELIIAFHPLIYPSLRQITSHTRVERSVVELIDRRIGLYIVHTAFDAHPDEPHLPPPPPPEVPAPAFDFDDLPPLEPHTAGMAHMQEPEPLAHADEDYFASEDAIGTKLDLAKAYMDMGDPEGARSMLEEVVAEGSDTQKAEAHRLMAELG